jgi:hypothetical protein
MRKYPLLPFVVAMLMSLAACKTWYKAGASEEDLSRDQQRCEDETGTSSGGAFLACMQRMDWRRAEWSSAGTDAGNAHPAGGAGAATPSTGPTDTLPLEQGNATAPSTTPRGAVLGEETEQPSGAPAPEAWVQFGAGAEQLELAKAECGKAGAGSTSFSDCMHAKGWRQVRLSVQEPADRD